MNPQGYPIVYGPVISWRLGISLGINATPGPAKTCNFNCLYCELGDGEYCKISRNFIPPNALKTELCEVARYPAVDHITIAGSGEPTLAINLGEIIQTIRLYTSVPIAVMTNAGRLGNTKSAAALRLAEVVIVKLDAGVEEGFLNFNRPVQGINFCDLLHNIENFRNSYSGKFCLQTMLCRENESDLEKIAEIAKSLDPDEIQVCSPTRGGKAHILSADTFRRKIAGAFSGNLNILTPFFS